MTAKKIGLGVVCLIFIWTGPVRAHHPGGGVTLEEGGPIRTISAGTPKKGSISFFLQAEYMDLDSFSDAQIKDFAARDMDVHTHDSIFHVFAGMSYGVTDDLLLSLRLPYVWLRNIRATEHEDPEAVIKHGDSQGIGDVSILGLYRFVNLKEGNFMSAFLFGLKMPTGRTDVVGAEANASKRNSNPGQVPGTRYWESPPRKKSVPFPWMGICFILLPGMVLRIRTSGIV